MWPSVQTSALKRNKGEKERKGKKKEKEKKATRAGGVAKWEGVCIAGSGL
jgi:hypothetical protein